LKTIPKDELKEDLKKRLDKADDEKKIRSFGRVKRAER
jgi:CRISPR/Cas system CSM-associated protein Csm2 small subunit